VFDLARACSAELSHDAGLSERFQRSGGAGNCAAVVAIPLIGDGATTGAFTFYGSVGEITDRFESSVDLFAAAAGEVLAHWPTTARPASQAATPPSAPVVAESTREAVLDAIGRAHLSEDDLFIRYFAIGGMRSRREFGAFLASAEPTERDDDFVTIVHAIDERFAEVGFEDAVGLRERDP
jgi:hypothetical protein